MENEVLNFAAHRLICLAKKTDLPGNKQSTVTLLRATMARFQESSRCVWQLILLYISSQLLSILIVF